MSQHYEFGKNWQNFIDKCFTGERLAVAQSNLLASLHCETLRGQTFLDIGCGSGLHSLAAWRSGAASVVSFDYDQDSVNATRLLWERTGSPENWRVLQGSVLDTTLMRNLGTFDFVYSWGVLHHTGDMRAAIRNAALALKDNGVFLIALYSDACYRDAAWAFGHPLPEDWLRIKRTYNDASPLLRRCMEWRYVWRTWLAPAWPHPRHMLRAARQLRDTIREKQQQRGMDFWTDIRDWLGGWPMEFAHEQDILRLCREECGLEPLRLNSGEGNTEFLFRPKACANYWDAILAQREVHPLPGEIRHEAGHMYAVHAPDLAEQADNNGCERRSTLTLFEDGLPLGYRHAQKIGIERAGEGRYLHWGDTLYFSSSDSSDPRSNGRSYRYCLQA